MGSIVVPAILRFSRVTVDNLYQINKSLNRLPHASHVFSWRRQHFGTITEEKKPDATDVPPISEATIENEKKLKTELELIKEQIEQKEPIKEQQKLIKMIKKLIKKQKEQKEHKEQKELIKEQHEFIDLIEEQQELIQMINEHQALEESIEWKKEFIRKITMEGEYI